MPAPRRVPSEGVPAQWSGAASVALRGLGAERTLLLVNGRRLAPSGVRGAPVAPDLNLIPSAMIDRIEILTDGASSIYGADAVAGVVNIMLRDNFEGMELNGFTSQPAESGGEESLVNVVGGTTGERGNFTVAAEYFERDHVMARERTDWNSCLLDIETDPATGDRYSVCQDRRPDNSVFILSQGFVFRTPGTTDIGVPGYSTNAGAADFIGRAGTNALLGSAEETPYNLQQEELDTQLQGNIKRANLYATGHYEYMSGHRAYIETSYSQRRNMDIFTSEQAFPGIPAMIPQMDANGDVVGTVDNPLNPFDEDALPVNTLSSLTQRRRTDIDNFRIVLGGEGELPIGSLADRNWIYDVFASWEESSGSVGTGGHASKPHVRESIDTLRVDADGNLVCGLERTALSFGFLTPSECVPVNFFADSVFSVTGGSKRFSQEAEDFLFGNVINTTNLEQIHVSGLVTGDLFEMPAGMVGLVLGMEWRENSIDSANDIVRAQALSASEAPDQEADTVGETSIFDFYAETEFPLTDWALLNLSGRYTDEENFGNEFTYSVKGQIEPTSSLRFRATYGTTFRAPNLREQFLAGQAGVIAGENDPCIVPLTARSGGVYDPAGDTRSQRVLDNCQLDGVDPTALGLQANVLIPTETGGSEDIGAETSESFTVGFVWTQI
ncbi:MAG: TonB-dependent receptor [Gammaproteobacteria bacterium]|nr:TonB-dependent receptor [Gammaproteobacteria bacterium]